MKHRLRTFLAGLFLCCATIAPEADASNCLKQKDAKSFVSCMKEQYGEPKNELIQGRGNENETAQIHYVDFDLKPFGLSLKTSVTFDFGSSRNSIFILNDTNLGKFNLPRGTTLAIDRSKGAIIPPNFPKETIEDLKTASLNVMIGSDSRIVRATLLKPAELCGYEFAAGTVLLISDKYVAPEFIAKPLPEPLQEGDEERQDNLFSNGKCQKLGSYKYKFKVGD